MKEKIPTKLNVFQMDFDIDLPRFFNEEVNNSGSTMYSAAWKILLRLLESVAQRACELDDPIMNALMLRLNMYDVPYGERRECIEQMRKKWEEGV